MPAQKPMPVDPLGDLIRQGRLDHHPPLTQEELANLLGVRQSTVSSWEAGNAHPGWRRLVQVARLFDLDVGTLVEAGVTEP